MFDNHSVAPELTVNRDTNTGHFEIDVLANATSFLSSAELEFDEPYVSFPDDGKYGYVFKLRPHGLYYFKLLKLKIETYDSLNLKDLEHIEFRIIPGRPKEYSTQLRKMLKCARLTDEYAFDIYDTLKYYMHNEAALSSNEIEEDEEAEEDVE